MNGISICGYLWIVWFAIWVIWGLRAKPTQLREGVSSRLSYMVLTVAAFFLMFDGDAPRGWLRTPIFSANRWTEVFGIALTAAGLGFALWARAYLGSNWSGAVTVKVGHQLVRTGPYRWIRHPIYSGMILAMLGTALERRQVRGLVAVVLLYAGFKIKSRIEERAMSNTFGVEYEEYSRTTGAIVPRLRF
ncbi:MAG TPA: isoprenylcysteine carboxylmethyltransferase family protein [Terriglobales bacterium]|nr:isoprenylcysteine carboxylmethyltransferase family protein [Terriglobales bacterium]